MEIDEGGHLRIDMVPIGGVGGSLQPKGCLLTLADSMFYFLANSVLIEYLNASLDRDYIQIELSGPGFIVNEYI